MRAMINGEGWPYILNTDQGELESMKKYWGDLYFDVPDELYKRYEAALEEMKKITREILALSREKGE